MFGKTLSALNVAGVGKRFAIGGIASTETVKSSSIIDYDFLASLFGTKVSEANLNLRMGVSVIEINEDNNNVSVVDNTTSF